MWEINYNKILSHMFPMRKVKQKETNKYRKGPLENGRY